MKYPRRRQYKYSKFLYRIRNWAEYAAGLTGYRTRDCARVPVLLGQIGDPHHPLRRRTRSTRVAQGLSTDLPTRPTT